MIRIKHNDKPGKLINCGGTRFYTEDGHEIKGVTKAEIVYEADKLLEVKLTVPIGNITYEEAEDVLTARLLEGLSKHEKLAKLARFHKELDEEDEILGWKGSKNDTL